jgi:cell division protein FtsB
VETGGVAEKAHTEGRPRRPKRGTRRARSRRQLRLVWLVGLVALSVYLYYRPLSSYFGTRNDLAAQRAQLASLRVRKAELETRLASTTSVDATQREARRIGYVRPGEQLFIVKGIPAWRKARRNLRTNG